MWDSKAGSSKLKGASEPVTLGLHISIFVVEMSIHHWGLEKDQ